MHEDAAYSTLLGIQGRQAELGYIQGRKWENLVRTAPINVVAAEVAGALVSAGVRTASAALKAEAAAINGPATTIRNVEILDRNGEVVARQNAKTGEYEAVAQRSSDTKLPALKPCP